jgi:hypothetical protein
MDWKNLAQLHDRERRRRSTAMRPTISSRAS